ncbi:hypothetical protein E2C01_084696 [Portunus trituberculatus]|uniref:Uncharacterized protein n=1 Tax=Portunus trituberculatus TaxID=210409 RepID=A0A5B7J8E8_PORTR|nr:hypothetical protein [Portunus trituberculatus]
MKDAICSHLVGNKIFVMGQNNTDRMLLLGENLTLRQMLMWPGGRIEEQYPGNCGFLVGSNYTPDSETVWENLHKFAAQKSGVRDTLNLHFPKGFHL